MIFLPYFPSAHSLARLCTLALLSFPLTLLSCTGITRTQEQLFCLSSAKIGYCFLNQYYFPSINWCSRYCVVLRCINDNQTIYYGEISHIIYLMCMTCCLLCFIILICIHNFSTFYRRFENFK